MPHYKPEAELQLGVITPCNSCGIFDKETLPLDMGEFIIITLF